MQERRRANAELAKSNEFLLQSRQQLSNIIDFLPDATFVVDNDKRVIAWNRAIEEMSGVSKDEMIGQGDYAYAVPFYGERRRQLLDLLDVDDEGLRKTYRHVSRKGGTLYAEAFAPALNEGKGAYFWATVAPLFDAQGNRVGAIESIRDISGQKQVETEREKLKSQLAQAQKMEAIGTLAGGIAHDFNNILGAILGYAEMARDDIASDSRVASDLDQVINAGKRARELVKQILAFSRQAETERVSLQPAGIVHDAVKLLRPSLPATIEIRQDIDAAAGPILADPTQLHQILVNLCTNAYHAMEETGGVLTISLKNLHLAAEDLRQRPQIAPGDFVQISVSDTGSGMTPEVRERIFEPYFTTKEQGKGTGMGLSIVHGIVQSHEGFLSCYSEPGEGTVFHVFLPVVSGDAAAIGMPVAAVPLGHERILFIDDEEILAEMAQTMLERLGYLVTVKNNSLEALAAFQNQPESFDLVITDQTMPGMTGMDLARRMLQIRPDLPIILCTGFSTLVSEDRARAIGIREFALKPLAKRDIAKLIRKVLDL
jgi:PAS domain S-box-containing protein